MNKKTKPYQQAQADTFRNLHCKGTPLILPNVWDAGTARLMEHAGSQAIATTSGGMAWSHGYRDGDQLPVSLLTRTISSIARVVSVPITVDIESGYSANPDTVEETVAAVIEAGAVGINIEDGLASPDRLSEKIVGARQAGDRLGVPLFINVRIDVYLRGLAAEGDETAEVIRRSELYQSACMDGLFVPGLADPDSIGAIAAAVDLPLNVMAVPGLPAAAELGRLGVRRLSAGTGLTQAAYGLVNDMAASFLKIGEADPVSTTGMSYPEINALFT